MSTQIEDARRQLTRAVAGFLRAVAASPDVHQANRDHAIQHGTFSQDVTGISGTCEATYLPDGSMEWVITSLTLSNAGTVTITERTRTWVVKDDDHGVMRPVADSNQPGADLAGSLLQGVACEVETMLHAYELVWLNPALTPQARQTPPVTRQQINQHASKPSTVLGMAIGALLSGWCCFLLGWITLGAAIYLVIREWRKLQGTPIPTMLVVSMVITALAILSVLGSTWFWFSRAITAFNQQPY